jgi:hypothetical protein
MEDGMAGETKFTPGPWVLYADLPSANPNWHIVTSANKQRVLANVHIEPGNATDEANALMIAAAPDMYEALKAAVEAEGPFGTDARPAWFNAACAALSKASPASAGEESGS